VDEESDAFPGVDDRALRRPSTCNKPRERTLSDWKVVKWCSECGCWGTHLCAGHTMENAVGTESGQFAGEVDADGVAAERMTKLMRKVLRE